MNTLLPIIIIGSFAGGFVQGLSGFGFAVIAMSCWAWMLEPQMAAMLTVIGALTGQTISVLTIRRGFNFKLLFPFLLGGLFGIPIGTALLPLIDADLFKALLGGFLLIWCPIMLMVPQIPPVKAGGRFADVIVGICGGIMSGLGGFAGVLPTLWCTLQRLDKDSQRSIIQNFNFGTLLVTAGFYIYKGLIHISHFSIFAVMIPIVILSSMLGARIYTGISPAAFRRIILILLTVSGIALLSSAIPKLL